MSVGKRYVLDANVFIEAHRHYYAFDICPGFWTTIIRQHEANRICSIDKNRAEIIALDDKLSSWVKEKVPGTFFKGTSDSKVSDVFRDMVNWVQNEQQFFAEAKAEFASVADGWIVAYAKVNNLMVVTHEEYAPDCKKKVPIPNLCIEFGVQPCNTFDMLRDLKVRFASKR